MNAESVVFAEPLRLPCQAQDCKFLTMYFMNTKVKISSHQPRIADRQQLDMDTID
jgi:hypothetical protein